MTLQEKTLNEELRIRRENESEEEFEARLVKEDVEYFMSEWPGVRPPDAGLCFGEDLPFEEAVEYALSTPSRPFGDALLEALRAKWPNDVENVLAKMAVV